MPTSTANLHWDFVPGSLSTLVEYKLSTDSTWLMPSSPANPTGNNFYPLTINNGQEYDVRLTTNGLRCAPKSRTLQIINGASNCCPATYILSPDGTYCYKYVDIAATPPSSSENCVARTNAAYGNYGALIYDPGYANNGTGTFTQISPSNGFWINPTANNTAGPLNRAGLWSSSVTSGQTVGFSVCINITSSATYYVGMGADNQGIINLDGTNQVTQDPAAIASYLNTHGFPGVGSDLGVTFKFWHIYPVIIPSGQHYLEIIGYNVSGPAAVGMEVYSSTSAQLQSATSYGALGSGLIFSSKDYIGQPIQIGSGGVGYTCPPTYSLVLCDGPAYCRQVLTTSTISC